MKRDTEKLKENLILTGVKEIKQNGIDSISLRTVAKSCGVTHGTPYRHFESKENYLNTVLKHISTLLDSELIKDVDVSQNAKAQLIQMGVNLIDFAKNYPNFFEALFIKFPFKYMKFTDKTISDTSDFPGFLRFKEVVILLRKEENFTNSESESLLHFWSFISGLAIIAGSPIGNELDTETIKSTIRSMLEIYIKGERQ